MSSLLKSVHDFMPNLLMFNPPGQLVIQITDVCNAFCAQCGMRVTNRFPRTRMKLDDVKAIIDKAAENDVKAISFTGGEPLLFADDLIEMITHAHRAGIPYIRTGTNGFLLCFNKDEDDFKRRVETLVEKLAKSGIRNFWISIDSACGSRHEKMRGLSGVIKGIEKALPIFESAGIYPSANLGINRYMGAGNTRLSLSDPQEKTLFYRSACEAFSQFYRFVIDLGFTIVNACYPMSIEDETRAVYPASSKEDIISFTSDEKILLFEALMDTIPRYRKKIRIFSPLSSLYALVKQYKGRKDFYPCLGGTSFFFIDSKDGNTYPCGYRGKESLGRYRNLNMDSVEKKPFCSQCDWECFRDPSQLLGPFMDIFTHPVKLVKEFHKDPYMVKYLYSDLQYYQRCGYFNGRKPPRI